MRYALNIRILTLYNFCNLIHVAVVLLLLELRKTWKLRKVVQFYSEYNCGNQFYIFYFLQKISWKMYLGYLTNQNTRSFVIMGFRKNKNAMKMHNFLMNEKTETDLRNFYFFRRYIYMYLWESFLKSSKKQ